MKEIIQETIKGGVTETGISQTEKPETHIERAAFLCFLSGRKLIGYSDFPFFKWGYCICYNNSNI